MRKAIVIAFMLFSLAGLAAAQIPTAGNVFVGYSYETINSTGLNIIDGNRVNMNGWEATLEGKLFPVLGIVADFNGHYGSQSAVFAPPNGPSFSGNITGHEFDVMFGPRVGVSVGKFRPFGEFEIGVGHMNTNIAGSDSSFATAVGGGIDYKIVRIVGVRLEGDYVTTRFFGTTQNNFRLSTGLVVHF
jgi:opacity protein-like surface antigen